VCLLWSVQTGNILGKLDPSLGKARANIKGGWQERSFAIIAGRTYNNCKRTLEKILLDRSLNIKNNKASEAVSRDTNYCKEITISSLGVIFGQVAIFF